MTLESLQQAQDRARSEERCADRYADAGHGAVRDLTRHLDPATLRQVMSWLERTRTAAFALRGTEQAPHVRPVVRHRQF
ncbi:hypothetical protein [Kitasatospora sp. NPDC048407]|uniref:hypothetical protein n=1 Tax=Kitasatospora sp. NPDC048407 TaxID=3364051 RepID=UPI0037208EDE